MKAQALVGDCVAAVLTAALLLETAAGEESGGLLQRAELLRFQVSGGRFVVPRLRSAHSREISRGEETGSDYETLDVRSEQEDGGFSYRSVKPGESRHLEYGVEQSLSIRHEYERATFVFEQDRGMCRASWETAGNSAASWQIKADDVWRLLLSASPEQRAQIARELDGMFPGGALLDQTAEIEKLLSQTSSNGSDASSASTFVSKVSSPAAGRLLPDHPTIVARRLREDAAFWLIMLHDERSEMRTHARSNLERLLGRPLAFSPEADAKLRREQAGRIAAAYFPNQAKD